ncbi:unnamed protein product [Somion occarium]
MGQSNFAFLEALTLLWRHSPMICLSNALTLSVLENAFSANIKGRFVLIMLKDLTDIIEPVDALRADAPNFYKFSTEQEVRDFASQVESDPSILRNARSIYFRLPRPSDKIFAEEDRADDTDDVLWQAMAFLHTDPYPEFGFLGFHDMTFRAGAAEMLSYTLRSIHSHSLEPQHVRRLLFAHCHFEDFEDLERLVEMFPPNDALLLLDVTWGQCLPKVPSQSRVINQLQINLLSIDRTTDDAYILKWLQSIPNSLSLELVRIRRDTPGNDHDELWQQLRPYTNLESIRFR